MVSSSLQHDFAYQQIYCGGKDLHKTTNLASIKHPTQEALHYKHQIVRQIIFFHGFMGSKEDWIPITERLQQQLPFATRLILVDLSGHGDTPFASFEKSAFDQIIEKLRDFLTQFKAAHNTLIGYSLGGRVALALACQDPSSCDALILESTSPGLTDPKERRERFKRDQTLFREVLEATDVKKRFAQFLHAWYQMPLFRGMAENRGYQKLLKRRLENDPLTLQKVLTVFSLGQTPSYWDRVKALTQPILYICGGNDNKYVQIGKDLTKRYDKTTLRVIEETSHNVHFLKIDQFSEEIITFLLNEYGAPRLVE